MTFYWICGLFWWKLYYTIHPLGLTTWNQLSQKLRETEPAVILFQGMDMGTNVVSSKIRDADLELPLLEN